MLRHYPTLSVLRRHQPPSRYTVYRILSLPLHNLTYPFTCPLHTLLYFLFLFKPLLFFFPLPLSLPLPPSLSLPFHSIITFLHLIVRYLCVHLHHHLRFHLQRAISASALSCWGHRSEAWHILFKNTSWYLRFSRQAGRWVISCHVTVTYLPLASNRFYSLSYIFFIF